jgi:flagellar biosynthesis GTPase FlhF
MVKPKRIMTPALLALLGTALAAYAAFWSARKQETESTRAAQERVKFERELREKSDQQAQAQRELREKSDEIAALYQKIAESQEELRKTAEEQTQEQRGLRQQSDEIARLNREIAEAQTELRLKSDEVAELNKTTAASVTGGDSYCYVQFINSLNGLVNGRMMVIHQGKFPLYDVQIRIVDLDKFNAMSKRGEITIETVMQSEGILNIGNMSPNLAQMREVPPFSPTAEELNYNIFISARNGSFTELLRLKKINGVWKSALKVERGNFSDANPNSLPTLLFEQIDAGFPLDKNGRVVWDK